MNMKKFYLLGYLATMSSVAFAANLAECQLKYKSTQLDLVSMTPETARYKYDYRTSHFVSFNLQLRDHSIPDEQKGHVGYMMKIGDEFEWIEGVKGSDDFLAGLSPDAIIATLQDLFVRKDLTISFKETVPASRTYDYSEAVFEEHSLTSSSVIIQNLKGDQISAHEYMKLKKTKPPLEQQEKAVSEKLEKLKQAIPHIPTADRGYQDALSQQRDLTTQDEKLKTRIGEINLRIAIVDQKPESRESQ